MNSPKFYNGSDGYLKKQFEIASLKKIVKDTVQAIHQSKIDFDTIAVTGISGITVGLPASLRLNKQITIIRKEGEKNHSWHKYEGLYGEFRYIIVDDGIGSGNTVKSIGEVLRNESRENNPILKGIFLYNQQAIGRTLEINIIKPFLGMLYYCDESYNQWYRVDGFTNFNPRLDVVYFNKEYLIQTRIGALDNVK